VEALEDEKARIEKVEETEIFLERTGVSKNQLKNLKSLGYSKEDISATLPDERNRFTREKIRKENLGREISGDQLLPSEKLWDSVKRLEFALNRAKEALNSVGNDIEEQKKIKENIDNIESKLEKANQTVLLVRRGFPQWLISRMSDEEKDKVEKRFLTFGMWQETPDFKRYKVEVEKRELKDKGFTWTQI